MSGKRTRKVSDRRWVTAIENAERGDLRDLVRALLIGSSAPDWVRRELMKLFKDERGLSPYMVKVREAKRVFQTERNKQSKETDDQLFARVAREQGVSENRVRDLFQGKGKISQQVRRRG